MTIEPWLIVLLAFWVACAIASGYIAKNKGYSYNLFALLGLLTGVIGLVITAVLPAKAADNAGNADALMKYKELLDSGAVSQEEFDRKKTELLK